MNNLQLRKLVPNISLTIHAIYHPIVSSTFHIRIAPSLRFPHHCGIISTQVLANQVQSNSLFTRTLHIGIKYRVESPIQADCVRYLCQIIEDSSIDNMADNKFVTGYAKLGTSSCKKCKQKIEKGALRIGKVVTNPFSDEGGDMKQWYHPACIFETFKRARATTKKIEEPDDLEGFTDLEKEDRAAINKLIDEFTSAQSSKTPTKRKSPAKQAKLPFSPTKMAKDDDAPSTSHASADAPVDQDDSFREFRRLCAAIAEESSYTAKTKTVKGFITKGSDGECFMGDLHLWLKLLLPGVVKRVYNLNNKQLVKLFSQIFGTDLDEMVEDLEQGDVAETIRIFFEQSTMLPPVKKSNLSIQQVDNYLQKLTELTKEDEQMRMLKTVAKRCTANDLKMFIRLIKKDLRINAGAKHILDALDENAYAAFQVSRNLQDIVDRVMEGKEGSKPGMKKQLSVKASLMTPILPMLAEACRSVEYAMKKCPNGFYSEIKYDGERVQIHKKGDSYSYFSRSLKPVLPHKVQHFKEYIPKAFPTGDNLILDAEVLLVDTKTSKPLPFGTLGVHKKAAFKEACVCLFVFDCMHLNGENIMNKPIKERRKILEKEMTEIPNRIVFSELNHVTKPEDLQEQIDEVFSQGLEGLVLKDVKSVYEPGKRHWLKIKKDYLAEGTMADSADLSVLGAYYGSGRKGGIMSIFLLGVYNPDTKKWCTVTKCHSGLDDDTLQKLQTSLDMVKISKDESKVPSWLNVKKAVVPDFVSRDPKSAPVWEIVGAEFSKADIHTADGISIRFPRITKFREDKSWDTATNLRELRELFKKSKEVSDVKPKAKNKNKNADQDDEQKDGSDTDVNSDSDGEEKVAPSTKSPKKTVAPSPKRKTSDNGMTDNHKVGTGKKRGHDSDGEDTVTPKKKSTPECKYGATCYQTNPHHLKQFTHPGKKMPTVFRGCKIYLPENIKKFRYLRRFIIGWDGDLVPEYDKAMATHIIIPKGKQDQVTKCKGVCVSEDWLYMCIKKSSIVQTKPYIVE